MALRGSIHNSKRTSSSNNSSLQFQNSQVKIAGDQSTKKQYVHILDSRTIQSQEAINFSPMNTQNHISNTPAVGAQDNFNKANRGNMLLCKNAVQLEDEDFKMMQGLTLQKISSQNNCSANYMSAAGDQNQMGKQPLSSQFLLRSMKSKKGYSSSRNKKRLLNSQ